MAQQAAETGKHEWIKGDVDKRREQKEIGPLYVYIMFEVFSTSTLMSGCMIPDYISNPLADKLMTEDELSSKLLEYTELETKIVNSSKKDETMIAVTFHPIFLALAEAGVWAIPFGGSSYIHAFDPINYDAEETGYAFDSEGAKGGTQKKKTIEVEEVVKDAGKRPKHGIATKETGETYRHFIGELAKRITGEDGAGNQEWVSFVGRYVTECVLRYRTETKQVPAFAGGYEGFDSPDMDDSLKVKSVSSGKRRRVTSLDSDEEDEHQDLKHCSYEMCYNTKLKDKNDEFDMFQCAICQNEQVHTMCSNAYSVKYLARHRIDRDPMFLAWLKEFQALAKCVCSPCLEKNLASFRHFDDSSCSGCCFCQNMDFLSEGDEQGHCDAWTQCTMMVLKGKGKKKQALKACHNPIKSFGCSDEQVVKCQQGFMTNIQSQIEGSGHGSWLT